MIHAYDKIYLEKARAVLGRMLDFAVHDLKYNLADFFDLFINFLNRNNRIGILFLDFRVFP